MTPSRVVRLLLIAAGTTSMGIGLVGVVVPVLPTTPFLLLSAACYARSSRRMHCWLHFNPLFGPLLRSYRQGKGVSKTVKIRAITLVLAGIGLSALFAVPDRLWWVRIILAMVALGVSWHIASLPVRRT